VQQRCLPGFSGGVCLGGGSDIKGEVSMPFPSVCNMPDLSMLKHPLMSWLMVQDMFVRNQTLSHNGILYRRHFVRLVDKAIYEYGKAREAIIKQIEEANRPPREMEKTGRIIYMIDFTDRMENCVNAISRLYKFTLRFKSEILANGIPREIRRMVETKETNLVALRNSIEHVDEKIQNGAISPEQLIMLGLNEKTDGISIMEFNIEFTDLAFVLKKMHEIAIFLLTPITSIK
jgi:hypothetical protein